MFKLLRNYVREQKNNLLQMFGLGFLIVIMIVAFLALNFSNNYLMNQYVNDIVNNGFNQNTQFDNLENVSFFGKYDNNRSQVDSYLDNINYYQEDKNNPIDKQKMAKATFQLLLLNPNESDISKLRYRFIFHGGNQTTDGYFAIANNLYNVTNHEYLDFKIKLPPNYPTVANHATTLKNYASILNKYVYNPLKPATKTNFMITSKQALQFYNNNFLHKLPYANQTYDESDISNQAKLYEIMSLGMLYKNIEWQHSDIINDLLITSKNFAFIETGPDYFVNKPIIVKNGGASLQDKPLKDDEILIYEQFAKLNNLHLGQSYIIAGQTFIIRGYVTSAFAAYVGAYFSNSMDLKNDTVAFTNAKTMNKVEIKLKEFRAKGSFNSNFLGFNPQQAKDIDPLIDNSWIYNYLHHRYSTITVRNFKPTNSARWTNGIDYNSLISPLTTTIPKYTTSVQEITFDFINNRINIIKQIARLFLVLIFIVTVIIIFIITFKMIDRNKKIIGVLKAIGYKSWQLSISLVVSIVIPLLFFAMIGVLISIPIAHLLIIITNINNFALISYGWYFSLGTAVLLIVIPMISLTIISFLLVLFLLRIKPLDLILNNASKQKYKLNSGEIYSFITRHIIRSLSYRNKLAITTSMRSFGKTLIMCFTSIFAATLVYFALAASGLVNNMLGTQFAGTDFNYQNQYKFDNNIKNNFISKDNKLLYQFNSVNNIKNQPSLYPEILQAFKQFTPFHPSKPIIINVQNRYIMGSELLKIRKQINAHRSQFPPSFVKFLDDNKVLIDYLTNNNGKNKTDLLLSFGLIPFDEQNEEPYTQLLFDDAHTLSLDIPNISFDNTTQKLSPQSFVQLAAYKKVYGIDNNLRSFLSPTFALSSFSSFSELNLKQMKTSTNWQDIQFMRIRHDIIQKLGIEDPDNSSVQFIPMATSSLPTVKNFYAGGEALGQSIIYRYQGLDHQQKYIIGIAYDHFDKLAPDVALMPKIWLNNILFGNKDNLLSNQFSNSKLSKFNDNEFKHYLPIISSNNDYNIDLAQVSTSGYLESKGIGTSLSSIYDISNLRSVMKTSQYSLQVVITFFGIFSVILSLMIVVIITNISVRDNLILINILRSLGYTSLEVSYNFFLVILPVLIMSSLVSVFIVPTLVGSLSTMLTNFAGLNFPIIIRWWYFALMITINVIIYLVSYIITWKLNVNNKQLMTLTK